MSTNPRFGYMPLQLSSKNLAINGEVIVDPLTAHMYLKKSNGVITSKTLELENAVENIETRLKKIENKTKFIKALSLFANQRDYNGNIILTNGNNMTSTGVGIYYSQSYDRIHLGDGAISSSLLLNDLEFFINYSSRIRILVEYYITGLSGTNQLLSNVIKPKIGHVINNDYFNEFDSSNLRIVSASDVYTYKTKKDHYIAVGEFNLPSDSNITGLSNSRGEIIPILYLGSDEYPATNIYIGEITIEQIGLTEPTNKYNGAVCTTALISNLNNSDCITNLQNVNIDSYEQGFIIGSDRKVVINLEKFNLAEGIYSITCGIDNSTENTAGLNLLTINTIDDSGQTADSKYIFLNQISAIETDTWTLGKQISTAVALSTGSIEILEICGDVGLHINYVSLELLTCSSFDVGEESAFIE